MKANIHTIQRLAVDPQANVWVAASAGTGKTKLLTDRLLNLMIQGNEPERILCLTFTQAAAAEMQNRLMQRLGHWATLSDDHLGTELHQLLGTPPTKATCHSARQLFVKVLNAPGGMKIQTIHSFCQSLLARFPLEAHLPPTITLLEDQQATDLLHQARDYILMHPNLFLGTLLKILSSSLKEASFQDLLEAVLSQRSRLRDLLASWQTPEEAATALKEALEFPKDLNLADLTLIQTYLEGWSAETPYAIQLSALNHEKPHPILSEWLAEPMQRPALFEAYCSLFLTIDGRISSRPKIKCAEEANRVYHCRQRINALSLAQQTFSLYAVCREIFTRYQILKMAQGYLDYDDLIEQARALLSQTDLSSWILYKLDGGIDHILVDEAQDTNPTQWQIIQLLAEELFTSDRRDRTLFIVGDAKQSIYSFQGANPKDFMDFRHFFSERLQWQQFSWRDIELEVSFRSAPAILELVDRVFAEPTHQQAILLHKPLTHQPFRQEAQGCIEIWPAVLDQDMPLDLEPWPLPQENIHIPCLTSQLAGQVADHIATLLQDKLYLPTTQKAVEPKDILILLRKRSAIVQELIRALKRKSIPVAGADRLKLHDHLAVTDLIALGQFAVFPEDDLTLASVLKSPLIGLTEMELYHLAQGRSGSLWAEVKKDPTHPAYLILNDLLNHVDYLPPYAWFQRALIHHHGQYKFLTRLGLEAEDVINEFLAIVLDYQTHSGGGLQQVLDTFTHQIFEIKRDSSDQHHNHVRLMTVHGAKGLQTPVVILLEHLDGREPIERILWHANQSGKTDLMLIRPSQDQDIPLSRHLKQTLTYTQDQEDKRLLYVALTRAQDHLFVGGWGKKLPEGSWYAIIQHHRQQMAPTPRLQHHSKGEITYLHAPIPTWIDTPVPELTNLKVASPAPEPTLALTRGTIIHKLLETLAPLPAIKRPLFAHQILVDSGEDPVTWKKDISHLLDLLDHPDWQPFFAANSQAEVDIYGFLNGRLFQGRIDRLVEVNQELWILDYKSTQMPPVIPQQIPQAYRHQLEEYKTCLQSLYPHKQIRCFLLWTETLCLMEIT